MHMWRNEKKKRETIISKRVLRGMSLVALQCKLRPVWCQWAIITPPPHCSIVEQNEVGYIAICSSLLRCTYIQPLDARTNDSTLLPCTAHLSCGVKEVLSAVPRARRVCFHPSSSPCLIVGRRMLD